MKMRIGGKEVGSPDDTWIEVKNPATGELIDRVESGIRVERARYLEEIREVMDRIAQGVSKEFRSEMREGREIYEQLKSYGFPILTKDYTIAYGLGIDVLEVKKLEKKELKEEVFLPPNGYHRIVPELPQK